MSNHYAIFTYLYYTTVTPIFYLPIKMLFKDIKYFFTLFFFACWLWMKRLCHRKSECKMFRAVELPFLMRSTIYFAKLMSFIRIMGHDWTIKQLEDLGMNLNKIFFISSCTTFLLSIHVIRTMIMMQTLGFGYWFY